MVLNAVVGAAAAKLQRTTAGVIDKLEGVAGKDKSSDVVGGLADKGLDAVAESGGAAQAAGAEGIKAGLHGKNPAWAAVRGAWNAGSPAVRAAIVTAAVGAVLLLVISPVLALVYLLSWLVIAAVHRTESTRQRRVATA
jgi:hypothetical protein